MICSFTPMAKLPRPSKPFHAGMPRKSRTRGSAIVTSRSRNSYIRVLRSVTLQPIARPSRILDLAGDVQHPGAHAGRLVRLRVDLHHVQEVDGRLPLDDAAVLPRRGRLGVTLADVHALIHRTVLL